MNSSDLRDRDEAARDRDDVARDRDDVSRIHDDAARQQERQFYSLMRRYSTVSVVGLCVILTLLWTAIVWRQNKIINRLDTLDKTLQQRTGRFQRLEEIEKEQGEILRRLDKQRNETNSGG